jgi:GntR family transcriptional regulator, negative regulator for fad regulon and positive regulator of fabA
MQKLNPAQPLRPTQHVEKFLVTSILDGAYPPGATLPNERSLAKKLGITRPTLRETLQRLAAEGWVSIRHGKSTVVNDYWQDGGLSLLSTLAKYGDFLPNGFITHLLEVRLTMLPPVAGLAATYQPDTILKFLSGADALDEDAEVFSNYDWDLQMLMARNSQNPVFALILNDFASIFNAMGRRYFSKTNARQASRKYYRELSDAIKSGYRQGIERVVKKAMRQSITIWQERQPEISIVR